MTATQAIDEITATPKYYIGIMSQQRASAIIIRFQGGRITLRKLEEFLNAFGYVERDGQWIKTKVERPNIKRK